MNQHLSIVYATLWFKNLINYYIFFKLQSFMAEQQFMHVSKEGQEGRGGDALRRPVAVTPSRIGVRQRQHHDQQQACDGPHLKCNTSKYFPCQVNDM